MYQLGLLTSDDDHLVQSDVKVREQQCEVVVVGAGAAGLMASFVWTAHDLDWTGEELRYVALAVTVVASLLMVSRFRYTSFKGSGRGPKSDRVPFFVLLIAVAALIALWIDPPKTLLAVTGVYALSGPVLWLWRRRAGAAEGTAR
jgi:CDP-diacylglycerol---serine O-phosphatidyltransferase